MASLTDSVTYLASQVSSEPRRNAAVLDFAIEALDEVTLTIERDIAFSPLRLALGGITEVTPGPDERVSASYTLSTFGARAGF
jgi:hypothetical protein